MKINDKQISIGDLRAETLINTLFPGDSSFFLESLGMFYSNYCEDLLEITSFKTGDKDDHYVSVARDGIYHLLPETLFFGESFCSQMTNDEEAKRHKQQMLDFFVPFDTEFFKVSLALDSSIENLEQQIPNTILKALYHININEIHNKEIRCITPFILHSSEIRGNYPLLKNIISAVTRYSVSVNTQCVSKELDNGEKWYDSVIKFTFHIPKLDNKKYNSLYNSLGELMEFIAEWFLPFDQDYEYAIKESGHPNLLNGTLTLDYNTHL